MKWLKVTILGTLLVFLFSSCALSASTHISNNTKKSTTNSTANVNTNNINMTLSDIESAKKKLVPLEKSLSNDNKKDTILKHLNNFREKSDFKISSIYFGDESGNFYMDPAAEMPGDYDPRTRVWYKNSKKNGEYVSDIYIDFLNKKKILSVR